MGGENVPSLLPIADRVAFVGGDFENKKTWSFWVPWSAVEEVAGDCWEPVPELFPPRMQTLRWPGEGVLAKLRERAVEA
jgi:hypothetical protein